MCVDALVHVAVSIVIVSILVHTSIYMYNMV